MGWFSRKPDPAVEKLGEIVTQVAQTKTQLEHFFDLSRDPFLIIDPLGVVIRSNKEWTRVTGWTEEDMKLRPFAEFLVPEDVERTLDHFKNDEVSRVHGHDGFVNSYQTKDGGRVKFSWRSSPNIGDFVYATGRVIEEGDDEAR